MGDFTHGSARIRSVGADRPNPAKGQTVEQPTTLTAHSAPAASNSGHSAVSPASSSVVTAGARSVAIGGDASNTTIVTGDENTIQQTIYTGDQAYDVSRLANNPYLGLNAFTYAERDRYGGREPQIQQAFTQLTAPGVERTLFFITGASGSGKSSFVQAGLIPALEQHYAKQGDPVAWAVFRPGAKPVAGLAHALYRLKLTATGPFAVVAPYQKTPPPNLAPANQISLVVIDQFEELFSQSDPEERATLIQWLTSQPAFDALRMHIIATLRADYLPDLFTHQALYEQAKAGLDLRVMDKAQLQLAIQRPLEAYYRDTGKQWQPALLKRLVDDAAPDATYLPLLQVTLEALWRGGSLMIDHYKNLADAISQRAEQILTHTQDATGNSVARTEQDQATICQIFLDMVDISLDHSHHGVRHTRRLDELIHDHPERELLIRELVTARLLSMDDRQLTVDGQPTQTVDIIHEALIGNWARLAGLIQTQRDQLQRRRRFDLRLAEWLEHDRSNSYLLSGGYLDEAVILRDQKDVALQSAAAVAYLAESIGRRNREEQAELEQQRALAEEQSKRATAESLRADEQTKRAAAEANRARTFRRAAAVSAILLLLASVLGVVVYNRQKVAERNSNLASARALVAQAQALQQQDNLLPVSMLLAIEAQRANPSAEAEELLRQGLTLLPRVVYSATTAHKVTAVAFSKDGQWVASADEAGVVQIRNTLTGTVLHSVIHASVVRDLAFDPTASHRLATSSNDAQVCLWDITTGARPFPCISHAMQVNKVLFSPNGLWLATATADGKACLWDAASGQPQGCAQHGYNVTTIAFDAASQWLVSGDVQGNLDLWDIDKAQSVATATHAPEVFAIAFSPDGQLASAGRDGLARLWAIDVPTATLRSVATFRHNGPVNGLAFSGDAKLLATVSDDQALRLWDLTTGWEKLRMMHADAVKNVTFDPSGKWLATASIDHTARVWDMATGQEIARLVHDDEVRTVAFSPDGPYIATGSTDKTAKVWQLVSAEQSRAEATGQIWAVAYHPQRQQFATTSADGFSVALWDASTGKQSERLPVSRVMATALAFSQDGRWLATGGDDTNVRIWQLADKQIIASLPHRDKVTAVAISPDGQCVASGVVNGVVQVRSPFAGDCQITRIPYSDTITAITYSASGQWLATASRDGRAIVQQVATQSHITVSHGGPPILAVAISPDEQLLATASTDRTVRIWQLPTGQAVAAPLVHGDEVREVAFSPDGQWLASGSADGIAHLWQLATHEEIARLRHSAPVEGVSFSPDGHYLVTSSGKLAQVWETRRLSLVRTVALSDEVCTRLARNLTPSEWSHYFPGQVYRPTCPNLKDDVGDNTPVE